MLNPPYGERIGPKGSQAARDAAPAEELPAFLSGLLVGYECLAANAGDGAPAKTIERTS